MPWNWEYEVEVEFDEPEVEYTYEVEWDTNPHHGGGWGHHKKNYEVEIEVDYSGGGWDNHPTSYEAEYWDVGNYQSWGSKNNDWSCGWSGWYEQNGHREHMHFSNFQIDFNGSIWGHGHDGVGKFNISGRVNQNQHFKFHKQYIGQHEVIYQGRMDHGYLTGKWNIRGDPGHGRFQINSDAPTWRGAFWQNGQRNNMELDMEVSQYGVFGSGQDQVGQFMIRGECHGNNVQFAKQYYGQHTVYYRGNWHGNSIEGSWQIPGDCNGHFKLTRC